jgi:hypothetical protein
MISALAATAVNICAAKTEATINLNKLRIAASLSSIGGLFRASRSGKALRRQPRP